MTLRRPVDLNASTVESATRQAEALKLLCSIPANEAIGVALSLLLYTTETHAEILRVALGESVVRNGFRGESMIRVLTRAAR